MQSRNHRGWKISSASTTHEGNVSDKERITRPPLGRTQPMRNWSMLFGAPGATPEQSTSGATSTTYQTSASLNDVVSRSVELGYRVIDEYIRQGQRAAQRFTERSYGADTMANDLQQAAPLMTQYASDFLALWFEFMQATLSGNNLA